VVDRLPPGTFVVVPGPPASGKTTLARAIAPTLGLPLLTRGAEGDVMAVTRETVLVGLTGVAWLVAASRGCSDE
jgi:cytidylate kinase